MAFLQSNAHLIGGLVDFLVYFVLTSLGASPVTAHVFSYLCAGVFYYGLSFSFRALIKNEEAWNISQLLYVLGFALMVFSLRGGIVFLGTSQIDLHPVLSFLPALLLTILANLYYIKFVHVGEVDDERHFAFFFAAMGIFSILVRFLFLGSLELLPEEAYYWNYATHLSAGYIDHPPMVGWLIALGTALCGLNEFGVRFFAWAASLGASFFIALLYLRMFGRAGMLWAAILACSIPYVFGAGFFISPDAGLCLFWAAALYFLHRALHGDELSDWIFLGAALGLGMLSKYTIALLGLPALFLCAAVPEWRRYFKSKGPYLAVLVSLVFFLPVIYWNATHEWASFAFQSTRRIQAEGQFSLHSLLVDMLCLATPTVFSAMLVIFLIQSQRETIEKKNLLFGVACFLLPVSIFIFYSLRHEPKLNWTGPSFLAVIPLVVYWLRQQLADLSKAPNYVRVVIRSCMPVFVIWFSVAGIALHYLGIGLPLVPYSEKMHRIVGWRSMVEAVLDVSNKVQAEVHEQPVLVGMDKHFIASAISFYGAKRLGPASMNPVASRNIVDDEALMFRYWAAPEQFIGKAMVLVARQEADLADTRVLPFFEKVGDIISLPLTTGGSKTRTYYYRVGYGYTGSKLTP